jgi:hypothetical protein
MTSFLVRHKKTDRFSFQRNAADEAPLAGFKRSRAPAAAPLTTETKPGRCELAKGGVS